MAIQHIPVGSDQRGRLFETPHWYAAYTCARHEKRVAEQLALRDIESFLPLYQTVRRWKNMRANVRLPLFPGYVFVYLPLKDRLKVLQLPSVARLVGFDGLPTPLPQSDIEKLRCGLETCVAWPHRYLATGARVRIASGPFGGMEGILVRNKGQLRFVVTLHLLRRSVAVEVDEMNLQPA